MMAEKRYELAENDPDYMARLDYYNLGCEYQDDDIIAVAERDLQSFGAWVDSGGYWRHPADPDKRPLDVIMGWTLREADRHHE